MSEIFKRLQNISEQKCRPCLKFLNGFQNPMSTSKNDWSVREDMILVGYMQLYRDNWRKYQEHLPGRTIFAIRNRMYRIRDESRIAFWRSLTQRSLAGEHVDYGFDLFDEVEEEDYYEFW
jgi:hypothetical protein